MATTRQAGPAAPTALGGVLAAIVRRLRLMRWVRLAARGALAATCLSLLAVGLAHGGLLPAWLPLESTIPVFLLFGVGLGTLFALRHPPDSMAVARQIEARLGLKERLSSALEFERAGGVSRDPEAALLLRLQQEDAATHAAALRPGDAVPGGLSWESKALFPALLLLVFALVLPSLPIFTPPAVRAERGVVAESGQEVMRAARVIGKRADEQGLPATKRAAQDMRKLGDEMARGRMDKKQAMVQMSQADKKMAAAQPGGMADRDDQGLADAGRRLAESFQPPADGKAGVAGGKSNAGSTAGDPGRPRLPSAAAPSRDKAEDAQMHETARSLKQGDVSGLSRQLREMARRTAAGPSPSAPRRQAAQDLQKLSDALKGSPLSEAQKHVQSAADAMKRGDTQRAAGEMKQAADAADRLSQRRQEAQGIQDARQALQNSEQRMAQASKPADIPQASPPQGSAGEAPQGSGRQGQAPRPAKEGGQGGRAGGAARNGTDSRRGGAAGGDSGGTGPAAGPASGHAPSKTGQGAPAPARDAGVSGDPARPLDPRFDPRKNPKYGKVYLGAGSGGSGGRLLGAKPGTPPVPGRPLVSSVPYGNTLAPARKSAETAMDGEDIPPAYRSGVRRYFDSLQPPVGKQAK